MSVVILRMLSISILIASCAVSPTASVDRVSHLGYLGVEVGMTPAEASSISGLRLAAGYELDDEGVFCHFVSPNGASSSFYFMVVEGLIARVDVGEEGIVTNTGVGVGSTEQNVRRAYRGQVVSSSHPYTGPDGHYLTVNIDENHAIVFETDGEKVERFRAGRIPPVLWIEGCS